MNTLISTAILGQLHLNKHHHPTPPQPPHPVHAQENTEPNAALAGATVAGWRHLVVDSFHLRPSAVQSWGMGFSNKRWVPDRLTEEGSGACSSALSPVTSGEGVPGAGGWHTLKANFTPWTSGVDFIIAEVLQSVEGPWLIADYGPSMVVLAVLSRHWLEFWVPSFAGHLRRHHTKSQCPASGF